MKILLKDGIRYFPHKYKDEDELEQTISEHSEVLFGEDSIFSPKQEIRTPSGIGTIPDGFLLLLEEKKWYVVEVELSSHPVYEHIVVQVNKFNSAIRNLNTRKKLIGAFYKEIQEKENIQLRYRFESKGIKELYKFLSDIVEKDPEIIIVIDEKSEELEEVCGNLPFRTSILEFKTYYREEVGASVHIHLFDVLRDYKRLKSISPRKEKKGPKEIMPYDERKVGIILKSIHTPKRYALIPIPKEHRSFFPGYKIPFILKTDIGEITTRVTSAPKGTQEGDPKAGNYIQGGLKPWYKKHKELKEGDKLIIETIESKREYKLSIE